ncbi:Pycsar system effector family protein [Paracoccus tegillarcae]|uniref:Pycsar effector protein domain-containing protein n=1 Tax=Paracoccus tegillarcae TaxID=1529068 RepID=A0A2K9EG00_9RHOB|nr:Pycsar system effector family protein [Paracoccus tegillarcae]AUH33888.1 hypothetical protein CUV01_11250 [Paracoccus tegillarcae]
MDKKKNKAKDQQPGDDSSAEAVLDPTVSTDTEDATADQAGLTKKEKKKKKKKAKDEPEALGSNKAVETMYRNAYRAELDTIALAATKANIMISLNGFIISALMISGAFIFASSPAFLLPAGVFLFTAATSIVFALMAASPERADLFGAIRGWMCDFWHRRAGFRDLRDRVLQASKPDQGDSVNLLIYEDRVRLTREEHWVRMQELMRDRERVYFNMSDHLYWLGTVTDRKFRLLNLSYTAFRWGLLATLITFVGLKFSVGLIGSADNNGNQVRLRSLGIGEFQGVYEPSAVQQLPDGRILVVEDEPDRAIALLSVAEDGSLTEDRATGVKMMRGFGRQLNDLEGLSIDDQDRIYATTSHSLTNKGERRPEREQLLRFRVSGGSVGEVRNYGDLRAALSESAVIKDSLKEVTGKDIEFDDLNIEGLAYLSGSEHLYVGLRSPLAEESSIIVVIRNPNEVFDNGAAPDFAEPILLDLQDGGIRALSYDPVLRSFLIVNEIEGYDDNRHSQLWAWTGNPEDQPDPIALPDIINLNNVESIDSITVDGEPRLLIMSDEGNEKKNEPARYMMLDYGQIQP